MCPFALVAKKPSTSRGLRVPRRTLWLCAMRADGARDVERRLTIEDAEKIHATDPDAMFLDVGRVGWCVVGHAFGRDVLLKAHRTRAGLASKKPWDVVRNLGTKRRLPTLRGPPDTPETFWHTWCGA